MKIFITGAAGYIGSVLTHRLIETGHSVIAYDNLSTGHRAAVDERAVFIGGDVNDYFYLNKIFETAGIDAVIHLAALSVVSESNLLPDAYFKNNVIGGIRLIDSMLLNGINKIIFSSSASVYGEPEIIPIDETHNTHPLSVYGETKLMFEKILKWYNYGYGLQYVSLRYFNASGADNLYGEDHRPETHLIPNVIKAIQNNEMIKVYGRDYLTADGTCVRDYVHVKDIADAHICALKYIGGKNDSTAFNLGSGAEYSVMQVIELASNIIGNKARVNFVGRRLGDPQELLASNRYAKDFLLWEPQFSSLAGIIEDAYKWHKNNPKGYKEIR